MCFLINEMGGEASGDMEEHLVGHSHEGDNLGAGFSCPERQCLGLQGDIWHWDTTVP